MAVVHLDQCFRAGTDDVEITSLSIGECHEIHVRARIEGTQHTIHIKRIGGRINIQSLRNDHLEHIAIDDMAFGLFNGTFVIAFLRAESQLGLADRLVEHIDPGFVFDGCGSLALHIIQTCQRFIVGGIGTSRTVIDIHGIGNQPYRARHVVDYCDVRGESQNGFRLSGLIRGFGTERRFPMSDGIPSDSTNEATGQIRQSLDVRSLQCLQRGMCHFDNITVGGHSDRHLSQPIGFAVVRTQLRHGIHADEAVSTPRSAKFSRFEDERTGTASCETLVEADWGQ